MGIVINLADHRPAAAQPRRSSLSWLLPAFAACLLANVAGLHLVALLAFGVFVVLCARRWNWRASAQAIASLYDSDDRQHFNQRRR